MSEALPNAAALPLDIEVTEWRLEKREGDTLVEVLEGGDNKPTRRGKPGPDGFLNWEIVS